MLCAIYKSAKKEGMYLYLPKESRFEAQPEALQAVFGAPKLVMYLPLEKKTLAAVENDAVREAIAAQGFYLQMPPPVESLLDAFRAEQMQTVSES